MILAVLADNNLKEEFQIRKFPDEVEIIWADSVRSLGIIEADAYFDLLFEPADQERISKLKKLTGKPVIVNSVIHACSAIGAPFIRINGWPTMLKRDVAEVAISSDEKMPEIKELFDRLQWKCHFVPDVTGMVTPRIVAMIINEAFYALGEGISTNEEIDTAMKLGTNYPYGPFEWLDKIGIENINRLLSELSKVENRYSLAPLLKDKVS